MVDIKNADFDTSIHISDDFTRACRESDLQDQEHRESEKRERERKNNNFFMMFRAEGSPALRALLREPRGAQAAILFLFLAEEMDRSNALVASHRALGERLAMSETSVSRAISLLVERKFISRLKSGGTNVFCANPSIVWSSYETSKKFALFNNSKILVARSEQDTAGVRRFNTVYTKAKKQAVA